MFNKGNLTALTIVVLLFIGFGDSFLPKPFSDYSFQTRSTINGFVIGLFPKWRPKVNPNQRTEKQLEDMQNNQQKK